MIVNNILLVIGKQVNYIFKFVSLKARESPSQKSPLFIQLQQNRHRHEQLL